MSADLQLTGTVLGDAALKESFLTFGSTVRDRLRGAMASLGARIEAAAVAGAPQLQKPHPGRTVGQLAASIKERVSETNGRISVSVGPTGRYGSSVGRWVEFGTVNHGGPANRNTASGKLGKVRRVSELRAQGQYRTRPQPFMEPASALLDGLDDQLEAAVSSAVVDAGF